MGNFCRYCGKPTQEGEVCTCQANGQEESKLDHQTDLNVVNGNSQATNQQFIKFDEKLVKSTFSSIKDLGVSFLLKPVQTLELALVETNKLPQFLIGLIYAVVLLLCLTIKLSYFKISFGKILLITLAFVLFKAIYAGALYIFAKKQNYQLKTLLGLFCLSSLPETVAILVVFLLSFIFASSYTLLIILLIMPYVIAISSELITFQVILKNDKDKCYWAFIFSSLIVTLIQMMIIKQAIIATIQSAMSSMGSILSTFY